MSTDSVPSADFQVNRTTVGSATVLAPTGSLTFETCAAMEDALAQVGAEARPVVVVDCRQAKAMDSEALELLVDWHHKLRENGGGLHLAELNDVCSDILMVTRLIHVLNVSRSIEDATRGE